MDPSDLHTLAWLGVIVAGTCFIAVVRTWINTSRIARLMEELVERDRPAGTTVKPLPWQWLVAPINDAEQPKR